jgi:nucleoside-diphosphate-sugar epimerase
MAISVVTGAAGFVGRALVRRLLADGDDVRAVVLPGDPSIAELRALAGADRLVVLEADVTDAARITPPFAGATRAFHAAALVHAWAPLARFRAINVGGTEHVARACLTHGVRLVAISTSDVFGIPTADETMDETSPVRPWNEPYADTKIEAARWLWAFRREHGLPLSIVYPGWVYGPGDEAFFPSLARAIAEGFMVFWARDVVLAWVYVDNLVDACLLASTHPNAIGEGYLVHDDAAGPTFEDVCARIARAIGKTPPRTHVPYSVAFAAASTVQTVWRWLGLRTTPPLLTVDVKAFGYQWHLSAAKIRRELGWTPRIDTETGMARALQYLVTSHAKSRPHFAS